MNCSHRLMPGDAQLVGCLGEVMEPLGALLEEARSQGGGT